MVVYGPWKIRDLGEDFYNALHGMELLKGMSVSWLEGIIKDKRPKAHRPNLNRTVEYQNSLPGAGMYGNHYVCGEKEYSYFHAEEGSRSDVLKWARDNADDSTGYVFGMASMERDVSHSCVFIQYRNRGYVMLPNAGLFVCSSPTDLNECTSRDAAFRRYETEHHQVFVEIFKW